MIAYPLQTMQSLQFGLSQPQTNYCMVPSNANDARGVITHELEHSATLKHLTYG